MYLDCICSSLGSSLESFVSLNFVSGELHTLINRKPTGSALNLYFLLGNTIVKCIYFLRAPVLVPWNTSNNITEVVSLWVYNSHTDIRGPIPHPELEWKEVYQYGHLQMYCLLILVIQIIECLQSILAYSKLGTIFFWSYSWRRVFFLCQVMVFWYWFPCFHVFACSVPYILLLDINKILSLACPHLTSNFIQRAEAVLRVKEWLDGIYLFKK